MAKGREANERLIFLTAGLARAGLPQAFRPRRRRGGRSALEASQLPRIIHNSREWHYCEVN